MCASFQYYESTRYVNNQKDSLIRQLRSEVAELRQKNTEYDRLSAQVACLDNQFRQEVQARVSKSYFQNLTLFVIYV